MNSLTTFFRTLVKSFTSPGYYADILKAKFGFSLKYFVLFNFLTALFTTAVIMIPVSRFDVQDTVNQVVNLFPSDLKIDVNNGRLSINKRLPYAIPFPQELQDKEHNHDHENYTNLVVFDSDKNVQGIRSFLDYETAVLVTETTIYAKKNQKTGEVQAYPIPAGEEPFSISSTEIARAKNAFLEMPAIKNKWYVPMIGALLWLLIIPFMTFGRFLTAIIYAILMYFVVTILKGQILHDQKLSYTKILQVSLHTLSVVIGLAYLTGVLKYFGLVFQLSGWSYLIAYCVITIIALSAATSNMQDVAPVAPVNVKSVPTKSKTKKG
jgi:hypothetical protein